MCSHLVMVLTASNVAYTLEQWMSYIPRLAYIAMCVLDCEPDLDIVVVGMYLICLLCTVVNLWWVLGWPGTTTLQDFILVHIKSMCVIKWCSTHWRQFCSKTSELLLTNQELLGGWPSPTPYSMLVKENECMSAHMYVLYVSSSSCSKF